MQAAEEPVSLCISGGEFGPIEHSGRYGAFFVPPHIFDTAEFHSDSQPLLREGSIEEIRNSPEFFGRTTPERLVACDEERNFLLIEPGSDVVPPTAGPLIGLAAGRNPIRDELTEKNGADGLAQQVQVAFTGPIRVGAS